MDQEDTYPPGGDGIGNACDLDNDGITASEDNCWSVYNPDQFDSDANCPVPPYNSDPNCGDACSEIPTQCHADIAPIDALDCKVNLADLVIMKTEFGRTDCGPSNPCHADIAPLPVRDNKVNLADLVAMKTEFGRTNCCP